MRFFLSLILLIAISIITAWYLTNYVYISDEERILRIIERARLSFESGSVTSISGLLDSDYTHAGGLDRAMVIRSLYQFFNDTENREIRVINSDIQINNDLANVTARFYFDADFKTSNSVFHRFSSDSSNNIYEIYVQLIKNNSDWKIVKTAQVE